MFKIGICFGLIVFVKGWGIKLVRNYVWKVVINYHMFEV